MKLAVGDKVSYTYPENSFPKSNHNGKTYTGIVTNIRQDTTHDRANVKIDTNNDYLLEIECNQNFISKI